jgi:hypothetical protein
LFFFFFLTHCRGSSTAKPDDEGPPTFMIPLAVAETGCKSSHKNTLPEKKGGRERRERTGGGDGAGEGRPLAEGEERERNALGGEE